MGYEGWIYYGTAGSTAATLITNSRDIQENFEIEEGDTTMRGAGTSPPINTSRVTARGYSIEWTMTMKSDDTTLTALKAAAIAGTPVAIHTVAYSGSIGYDGDVILSFTHGKPLKGEQTLVFTAKPNDDLRDPQLNA